MVMGFKLLQALLQALDAHMREQFLLLVNLLSLFLLALFLLQPLQPSLPHPQFVSGLGQRTVRSFWTIFSWHCVSDTTAIPVGK